jgi:hypothetical protein
MRRWFTASCIAVALAAVAPGFVQRVTAQAAPAGATAKCEDGSYSKAKTERGACSGHGGVATWFGAEKETAPAPTPKAKSSRSTGTTGRTSEEQPAPRGTTGSTRSSAPPTVPRPAGAAGATAQCNDGTYSHAQQHRGACSNHGGVKTWFK